MDMPFTRSVRTLCVKKQQSADVSKCKHCVSMCKHIAERADRYTDEVCNMGPTHYKNKDNEIDIL